MRSISLILAFAAGMSLAQDETSTSSEESSITSSPTASGTATETEASSTGSSSGGSATHTVRVGLDHQFVPDTIQADPGDTIVFSFYPQNHSVVQAELGQPCIPYNYYHPGEDTFFSGPVEQSTPEDPLPTWSLEVNSTEPVFFYCSAPESCIRWKMVGVINPNDTHNVDIQREFIDNGTTTFQLSPGEPFPEEGSSGSSPGSETPSGAPTPSSEPETGGGGPVLSAGAIAGIAIGGFAAIVGAVALIYVCGRKGGIEKGYRRSQAPPPSAMAEPVDASHIPYDNPQKSPAPTHATYSTYGIPAGHMDPYRSDSPAQFSSHASGLGSPHTSYQGHPSPGFPGYASPEGQQQQLYFEAPNSQAPVELPDTTAHR